MASVIAELSNPADDARLAEKRAALSSLVRLARTGSTVVWNENFRGVLRLLLDKLGSEDSSVRVLVLGVLTEMMRRCPLVQHFLKFSELIILRVLKAHADKVRDVVYGAQVSREVFPGAWARRRELYRLELGVRASLGRRRHEGVR